MVFKSRDYEVYRSESQVIKNRLIQGKEVTLGDLELGKYVQVGKGFIILHGNKEIMLIEIMTEEHLVLGDVVDLQHEGVFILTGYGWKEVK
jgi:hypothetical protein